MSEEEVEALLDKGFEQAVPSADVKIDAQLEITGLQGLEGPIRIHAEGPYVRGGKGELPKIDMDVDLGARDAGQNVQLGLLSTGDRAFVKFGGSYYEQAPADVARANKGLTDEGGAGSSAGSLADLGLDPRAWVVEAKGQGDEQAAGVDTEHVSGRLDVEALFRDLNKLVSRSANAIGGADPNAPAPLSDAEIKRLAEVVEDPEFDVYVGEDDNVIHRISARLDLTVPERDRAALAGISGGSLRLSVELSNVGGDQKVLPPSKAQPLSDLAKQLDGISALGGSGSGADGQTPTAPETSTAPDAGGSDVDAFERYGDCIDQAAPDDTAALGRCSELLR